MLPLSLLLLLFLPLLLLIVAVVACCHHLPRSRQKITHSDHQGLKLVDCSHDCTRCDQLRTADAAVVAAVVAVVVAVVTSKRASQHKNTAR